MTQYKLCTAVEIRRKVANAKPSSLYYNPFEGFDASNKLASSIKWTIENIIPGASISSIFGHPEGGKTFLALGLSLRVATGTPFLDKAVNQGPVFYFAPEGSTGLPIWRDAWLRENGWANQFVPFYIRGSVFRFSSKEDKDYLANTLSFVQVPGT